MTLKSLAITILSILTLSANAFSAGKDDYKKGWTAFTNNNRSEARKYFTRATSDQATKADAFLSLSLLDLSEMKNNSAFSNFKAFYEASNNPDAYLYGSITLPFFVTSKGVLESEKIEFIEKIIENPNMHGTLNAMLNQTLGNHYLYCNDKEKAKNLYSKIGFIQDWQVLGHFRNISGSGFDKNWGALEKATTKDVFQNNVGADVQWYTPTANKFDGWFSLDYYFPLENIIAYSQTFVDSPSDQEVYLRAGTSGSLKIWVNDALITSIADGRNADMDIYINKIKLNKGANRILVQIGQSEISAANFLIRITDNKGYPIPDIKASANYTEYTKSDSQTQEESLPLFAEEYLQNKIKEEPENYLHPIILAETYLRNDKADEAILVLRNIEKKFPKSSFVQHRLANAYLRANNQTYYSREMENIKLHDPDSFVALNEKFRELMSTEKYSDAEVLSAKIKKLYGENQETEGMELWLASVQNHRDQIMEIAKKLYVKYPYSYDHMNVMYMMEENLLKNNKAATQILEDYNKKYKNDNVIGTLSTIYTKQGDTEKGLEVLRQRIEDNPYAIGYITNMASILYKMQRYDEALQMTDRAILLAPHLSNIYNTRGYIYKEMKDNKNAIENFKKSIYYGRTAYDSRTQLRLLENKKEITELLPKVNLDDAIKKAPGTKDYPEDHSILLVNDIQVVFHPEGAKEYRYEIAVKILNQTGIETWKEHEVGSYGHKLIMDVAEVVKANGQKIKAETNNSQVVFTNLEVGDVLHLEYRLQDQSTDVFSRYISEAVSFQYSVPSLFTRVCILAPKDKKFAHLVVNRKENKNGKEKPITTEIEGMKLYQWVVENQVAVRDEVYSPNLLDIAPAFVYSSIPDWTFISNWYKDLTTNKFKSDFLLKETLTSILAGKENATQLEKARLFYEYILNNITYSNVPFMQNNYIPQKASRTISTRLGDCKDVSTLFVALCRESGIKANLVLVMTKDNSANTLALPTLAFNHCVAQVDIDNQIYYLELTDKKLPFTAVLEMDLKANILPIPFKEETTIGDKLVVMDMPFRLKNEISRTANVSFNEQKISIALESYRTGSYASYQRQQYGDLGNEEQLKQINQLVSSDYNTPVKVSNLKFKNLDNLRDSIICNYDIEIENAIQEIAGMNIFRLPWTDKIISLEEVALDKRSYPLDIWWCLSIETESEVMNIVLPEGKKFADAPKDINIECANASYQLIFNSDKAGIVTATRIFTRKTDQVMPLEYAAFKDFMNTVSANDNKQYAIN